MVRKVKARKGRKDVMYVRPVVLTPAERAELAVEAAYAATFEPLAAMLTSRLAVEAAEEANAASFVPKVTSHELAALRQARDIAEAAYAAAFAVASEANDLALRLSREEERAEL
jgi:hypothetical protein